MSDKEKMDPVLMFMCTKDEQGPAVQQYMLRIAMATLVDLVEFERNDIVIAKGYEGQWIAGCASNALMALMDLAGEPVKIEAEEAKKMYMANMMACAVRTIQLAKETGDFDDIKWIMEFGEEKP